MFDKIEILQLAHGLASHAASRQAVVARNIANADTPGYQAADIRPFEQVVEPRESAHLRSTREGHRGSPYNLAYSSTALTPVSETSPNGNGVSLETEMVKASEARHQHDLALAVYKSTLGIMRTSLGR